MTRTPKFRATGLRRSFGVLAASLVMAGCATPAPPQSPSAPADAATSSPTAGLTATPQPSVAFEIPAGVLPPFSLLAVAVDGLQLRVQPALTARVALTAPAGTRFQLANWYGPVRADGLDWYRLSTAEDSVLWAPIGAGDDAYLEPVPPSCPAAAPNIAGLAHLTEWERLACFGDRTLTVAGIYGSPVTSPLREYVPGRFEPAWLAYPVAPSYLVGNTRAETLYFRVAPDSKLVLPVPGTLVRATGHFNDSAAADCTMTRFNGEDAVAVDSSSALLYCREQFVLDSYERLGFAL